MLGWGWPGCQKQPSSHKLHLFQEIQTEFPSWRRRPEEPSRERHSIFEERGGRGVGEKLTHTKKTKTVAEPGMCLGESEPSLPSHPQLCWPGPAGAQAGRVMTGAGHQLPACSWLARLPATIQ